MTSQSAPEALIGTIVRVKRADRARAFDLRVDRLIPVDGVGVMLVGLLPSKKYPGDFRGSGWAWAHEVV